MSLSSFSSILLLEGSGQVNIWRETVCPLPSLPKYSVSRQNWQIDCCLRLSSSSLAAEHADFSFHPCAAQKTLPGLNTSLITKKSHVSRQRFDGLTRDEEKYLLNVRDYEIKSLESFLNLAHPCQLAELFWPGWVLEEPQACPGWSFQLCHSNNNKVKQQWGNLCPTTLLRNIQKNISSAFIIYLKNPAKQKGSLQLLQWNLGEGGWNGWWQMGF